MSAIPGPSLYDVAWDKAIDTAIKTVATFQHIDVQPIIDALTALKVPKASDGENNG